MRRGILSLTVVASMLHISVLCVAQSDDLEALFQAPLENRDAIIELVTEAKATYKKRVILEPHLIKALNNSSRSADAKEFIAQQLYRICDEDTVPAFVKLLYRRGTGTLAVRGLENISHPDAQRALMNALRKARGSTLIDVIGALGRRREPEAVESLRAFVQSGNTSTVKAALIALGEIGNADAAVLLDMSRVNVRRSVRDTATKAYLRCGWNALEDGNREIALTIFESLLEEFEPLEIRQQALRGYILTEQEYAIPFIVETLSNDVPSMQQIAAEEASRIPGSKATEAFVRTFASLLPALQLQVVRILGERGDIGGMLTVIQSLSNRDPQVRLAALQAIAEFDHPDSVPALLKTASTGSEEEKRIARETLINFSNEKMDAALIKTAMSRDKGIRLETVKMMANRNSSRGLPTLIRIANEDLVEIRFEALNAIGIVGTVDQLRLLVTAWASPNWTQAQRDRLSQAVITLAKRSPAGSKRVVELHSALARASSSEVQLSIIRVLNEIKEDESLSAFRSAIRHASPEVESEIVRILLNWPGLKVLDDLERLARTLEDPLSRNEAFKAYVDRLAESADHTSSSTSKVYQRALKFADTSDKRKLLLPGVARLSSSKTKNRILDTLAKDPAIAREVEALRD